jgi:uncharacterized protein with HEPN domain
MYDIQLAQEILQQILIAAERIRRRAKEITSPEDFIADDEGIDKLDAICMMLIAIGESLKKLDKITDEKLLKRYPNIDWTGAKGMRDIISHHYFDLNAEIVYDVCKTKLPHLIAAIEKISTDLKNEHKL